MMPTTDAVWGYVHGYRWEEVAGFVHSLRHSRFAGEIRFFCSGVAPAELEKFRHHGVHVEHSPYRRRRIKNPWSKSWPLLRLLPRPIRRLALRRVSQVMILRHLLYLRCLLQEGARYRAVMLSDVRDVLFQADPFQAWPGPGLHVFEEAAGRTIGSEASNLHWARQAFGPNTLEWLLKETILCSGTILGSVPSLIGFLEHFLQCFDHARRIRSAGIDQGVFNYAVRTWRRPDLTIHANGQAAVLTMGIMPRADIRRDLAGRVVRGDGTVIPVLHQFDRHPDLAAELTTSSARARPAASTISSPS